LGAVNCVLKVEWKTPEQVALLVENDAKGAQGPVVAYSINHKCVFCSFINLLINNLVKKNN